MGKILGYGEITVANMTEPFTVMLTNEAQQFATYSNRKVTSAQSYYTDIIVIRGRKERTDYTIGNITSGSGITVSKSSKRVTFSVSAGATIGADTGVIEIPITLDGQTVKKQFSWSCGKQGPQGVKGENGSKGKSVQNVIEYYLATSASSDVTSSTNGWSTDPTTQKLTAEKKYLWNCKQTVYDDGTKGSITSPVICGTYGDKGIDGKNATYITVSGTNFDTVAGISKMASYISINGTKYDFMPTRGHTLVIINPSNGAVENIKSYDTYTTTSLLDTPLSEVESDKIICLFTADASGLTQTSRNTLNECGSNLSDIWTQARKTHVFIGMKGLQKGQAYEIVASGSNATKTVTAYYTNSGIVTNGANGQDGISPKVSLSKSGDTTTISIVDATGTHTQTVKDGTNGTPGAAGKDGKTSYFHVKYSNDGGKTFTGNSGEDTGIYMGSYTDYTEADSTDVGKYTWIKVKGDKGDTGQKGQDGTSIKITSKSVTYQTSTSGTTAPTGTWSTTVPTVNNGQYLWTKTTVQYSDGNKTEAYSVSYKGTNGTNGTSVTVSKTEVTYQVSTSGTTAPTGTWSTTMPSCDQGHYLWTKTYVKYSDGKETTSYSVSYKGVDGEKFAWNLIKYGKGDVKKGFFKDFNKVENGYGELTLTSKKSYQGLYISDGFVVPIRNYPVGSKLIWSYDIMYTKWDFPSGTNHQEFWLGQRYTNAPSGETATGQWTAVTSHSLPIVGQNGCELNKWLHVEAKVVVPKKASDNVGSEYRFQFYNSGNDTATVTLRMKNVKLEYGDTATPWSPAQSDLEGRGVSETVQYYLATSQASGVTSSTSGWSTDITTQKLTADKKYLWNCYQTKYSDGTSEPISTPKVIGVYGDKGQKGDPGEDGQDGAGFHWNLLSRTKDFDKTKMSIASAASFDSQKYLGLTVIKAVSPTSGYIDPVAWNSMIAPTPNTQYTISFYAKASVETLANSYFYPNCTIKCISNHQTTTAPDGAVSTMLSTEWERYSVTWTTSGSVSGTKSIIPVRLQHGISVDGATVYLCGVKLEQSDKPSPWCTTYEETLAKNLSITPSSQYFKSTDGGKTFAPNTITIRPTIQGEISFGKWQYSIDGGVSFADVVSGQKGLTISNNVLTVSKDSSLYSDAVTMVTFRAVASDSSFYDTCSIAKIYDVSDIGDGRNLLTGVSSYTKDAPFEKTDSRADGWIVYQNIITSIELEAGKKYVLQAKTDGNWTANHDTNGQDPSKKLVTLWLCSDTTNDFFDMRQGYVVFTPTVTAKYKLRVNQYSNGTDAYTIHLWDIKLEKGSSPTGWTPAPEDVQTAILSTKSEISDVSLKVDNNKQAIEQRVEKTTYQQDLNLVKGDISKANEGLNKWRYEIYPKSLFASEYQDKSTMDVFAKNTNLTPSQSVLINDTDLSIAWNYAENYIGYALTFAKFSAAKSVAITFAHDDGAHIYLNGKLIGGSDAYSQTGESLTLGFVKGWNCIEVVVNEGASTEGFKLGTTISAISECQLMNCYYGTPVARQSHITNQLVENTTNIEGVTTTMQKVMTTVGGSDRIDEFVNNYNKTIESEKQFKKTIGETYTTKDEFNGLEIGGRNLLLYSQTIRAHNDYYGVGWLTDEVETFNGCPVWSVKNQWGRLTWLFKSHVIDRGLVKVGDTLTYSLYAKTNNASGKSINCSYRFKGNANAYWFNASAFNIGTSWARYSVTFTVTKDMLATDTYMNEIGFEETASMSGDDKVYYACPKLERGTKATDYTPAPEDDEINGQNLVSNLPSNWEQGTFDGNRVDVGGVYNTGKVDNSTRIRVKELVPVSGTITISNAYSNQSKKPIQHVINAFDVNKKYLGSGYINTDWNDFPKIVDMKDAKYIAVIVKYKDNSAITPSDISQICLKIERGTSATPFTLAPEDINGKIVNVETIANQTAKKFEWIVKGGDSSSNFTLTDRVADLVAERINFNGLVTFSGLSTDAKNEIGKVAQSKVDGLNVGGRNLALQSKDFTSGEQYWSINSNFTRSVDSDGFTVLSIKRSGAGLEWNRAIPHNYIPVEEMHRGIIVSFDFMCDKVSELDRGCICALQTYNSGGGRIGWHESQDILSGIQCKLSEPLSDGKWIRVQVPFSEGDLKKTYGNSDAVAYASVSFNLVANGSIHFKKIKIEYGNKATDWTPAPEDVSQDATNKASQALTDAKNYSSNAVNWVTNNGSSTTSLNSMVKKWTDGAVSDTTQINGGWIKANTITASKIAVGDFTNYADINESNTYGFSVEKTTDGVWFSKDGSKLTRDNYISKMYSCEPGQTFYVEYDISNTIKDSTEYKAAGIMLFGCDGTQTVKWYQRRGAVVGTAAGTVTHMSQQLTMPSGTRFFYVVLQIEGFQPFTGTLKIRNLSVRKAVTGAVIVDGSITADKIATDAIKSRNYISSGGTQGSFLNLSDGSFTSPNLSWDSNGNLIAKNANLSGQITATIGSIGGWNIGDTSLFTGITKSNVRIYDAVNADNAQNMYQKEQHSLILANTYINSFNSSLNSSDNYWHAQGVTINDGEFQVGETLYNPNLVNSDKDEVYYDRGLTRVFGGYITMSRDCSINSDSRSLYADIILNGEELYICTNRNILFSPLRTSIFTTEDPSKYNAIETIGDVVVNGKIKASNELQTTASQMRIISGSIGCMLRNDSADFYILRTNAGDPYGDWTNDRPFRINWATNDITCGHNLTANDLIANSWLYCSEVHSSGAVVIGADSESFYWAHGFQIARGTSWGGVCIGDDGQQLRLYGSSIWASHGISTSDENLKENFTTLDQYEDFYMNLNPIGFNYIGDYDGKKTHFGFGAHKTEDVLESEGYDADEFAVVTHRPLVQEDLEKRFGKDVEVDIETEYGVSYTEFIALNTHMIQKTRRELTKVKQEKADLEVRLQAIEAKLGL